MEIYLRLVVQLLATFISLLGVFAVFRLNYMEQTISDEADYLRAAADEHHFRIAFSGRRQVIRTSLVLLLDDKQETLAQRQALFSSVVESLDKIFQNRRERYRMFLQFRAMMIFLALVTVVLITESVPAWDRHAQMHIALAVLCIAWAVWFICRSAIPPESREFWREQDAQWERIKQRYQK